MAHVQGWVDSSAHLGRHYPGISEKHVWWQTPAPLPFHMIPGAYPYSLPYSWPYYLQDISNRRFEWTVPFADDGSRESPSVLFESSPYCCIPLPDPEKSGQDHYTPPDGPLGPPNAHMPDHGSIIGGGQPQRHYKRKQATFVVSTDRLERWDGIGDVMERVAEEQHTKRRKLKGAKDQQKFHAANVDGWDSC